MNVRLAITLLIAVFSGFTARGQNKRGFETMVNTLLSYKVDTVGSASLFNTPAHAKPILLDARDYEEYSVSHLPGALFVGYDSFELSAMDDTPKHTEIVVYCSVGKRSEDIAEKLSKAGFIHVKNLWGGIFDWSNRGYPLIGMNGNEVHAVHPYSKLWGIWINRCEKAYEP